MKRILVVDDDDNLRVVLRETLLSCNYEVETAESGNLALEKLAKSSFDLVITDLMMPGIKGIELIKEAKKRNIEMGAMVISAYGTIDTAVEAMKQGAFDFITKPFSISQIESRVERYFEYTKLQAENQSLKQRLLHHQMESKLVGQSKGIQDIIYHINVVANSDATVFIRGESGTGKELIAEAIHDNSRRVDKPFLKINCAAVPDTLFESTLFGHEKGSYSGAYRMQKGIFEECNGGTLMLDEISEIPYNMQAKLLRVLQEMKLIRVGSTTEIPIDVRIIATSNRDISELIDKSKFREDLFFRLNVFPITVPTLRTRKDDIPLLIEHFLSIFRDRYQYDKKTVSKEALKKLMNYNYPGNIRELQYTLERAVLYSGKEETIAEQHISFEGESSKSVHEPPDEDHITTLDEMEKRMIYAALKKTNNHRAKAAELLGITVRTLRNKLHLFEGDAVEEDEE
jgi:DNA-binding NtrC family response regulator